MYNFIKIFLINLVFKYSVSIYESISSIDKYMGRAYDARTNKHTAIKYYFIVARPPQSLAMTNIGRGIYDCVLVTFIMLFKVTIASFLHLLLSASRCIPHTAG